MEQGTGLPGDRTRIGVRFFAPLVQGFTEVTDKPAPTLRAMIKNIAIDKEAVVPARTQPRVAKPPYRVPTMAEIVALEPNGFDAISTFSGCGGSSTGYRMAGFRVLWASEFVPAARDTYRANAAAHTVLNGRDVRDVTGADILAATGKAAGELDLFDGSPPCASFSTAGARAEGWGKVKAYSDRSQRTDDLFFEYVRLINDVQPRTFVAENVSGLVKGQGKGYFKLILAALKGCGYRVEARLLDASWLGVPQVRQRLIFVGVRSDLGMAPAFPTPLRYQYTVRDALPWIVDQGDNGGFGAGAMRPAVQPSPTIGRNPESGNGRHPPSAVTSRVDARVTHDTRRGKPLVDYIDRPLPTVVAGGGGSGLHEFQVRSEARVIHDTSDLFGSGDVTDKPCTTITAGGEADNSCHYQVHGAERIIRDPETGADITIRRGKRPLARDKGQSPKIDPNIEIRKLTLVELRAIGGFPPDFVLTGKYGERWERIGRAVPPVMMAAIATAIRDEVLVPLRERGTI